jgi:glutamate racemase
MSDSMLHPVILVFDSGLGGLTVFREVVAARPDARHVYAADDAAFPYGMRSEAELIDRVNAVMGELIEAYEPTVVVIACNTASTIVLADLRRRFSLPFIGTVPAIKPACKASASRKVSVLGTEGTVAREYTRNLIRDFADGCDVTLVGAKNLAVIAEAYLRGEPISADAVAQEIAPCFVNGGGSRTDTVVLACTHFPLLIDQLAGASPWPVTFIDPAPAIARRVTDLIGPQAAPPLNEPPRIHFTSGKVPDGHLARRLADFGLARAQPAAV